MASSPPRSSRLLDNPELLRERLRQAPTTPGVYVMRDSEARVIYVGKAASVRNRLRSYFTSIDALPTRTRHLVDRVFDFEVVACSSEREALILENTLIKRHRPRFNVRLKDDKNYLYLKIPRAGGGDALLPGTARESQRPPRGSEAEVERAAAFPRPYYTRRLARDGARYFGPYTNAQALRSTVRSLRTIFPFRTCSDELFRRGRVCLDYHIQRCSGPCEARIDKTAYSALLEEVELFMEGNTKAVEQRLTQSMSAASDSLDFELAARYRDRLKAMSRLAERQRVIGSGRLHEDVVAIAMEGGRATVAVLAVRESRVVGMETHDLEGTSDLAEAECLGSFVNQFYAGAPHIPPRLLLSHAIAEPDVVADFLSAQRGQPVEVRTPQRGRGRDLVAQARETALAALRQRRIVDDFDSEKTEAILTDLAHHLQLPALPQRIECYDISNTMGTNSVSSMVVFEDGRPRPSHYRHFTIKTVEGANDFASMEETMRRRFGHFLRQRDAAEASADDIPLDDPDGSNGNSDTAGAAAEPADRDDSFGTLPDLVIIDGGKGQLGAAHAVLQAASLDVPMVGLAKRNEELHRPGIELPVVLPKDSPTLFLVQRVRDEAHRFAITHHRAKRGRAALRSRLDVVTGLGPVRKRALLRQFGSVDGIKQASVEELCALPEIPRGLALRLKELL